MHNALGVAERMRDRGAIVIRDFMPDQHRSFFADQQMVVLSALDSEGHPWPFLRMGPQGFMSSPSPGELCITSQATLFEKPDLNLTSGSKISVLGIEFETKRRNRLNGTIAAIEGDSMLITVDQSFGNCPRYIHARHGLRRVDRAPQLTKDQHLNDADIAQIRAADTFFIASRAPAMGGDRRAGVDVNHRGGRPGFVALTKDQRLAIPDYDGNKFFNTIGNILLDSRVSLMFFDFECGDVITLAGEAEVELDVGEKSAEFGTNRVIYITPRHILRAKTALPFSSDLRGLSRDPPVPGLNEDQQ